MVKRKDIYTATRNEIVIDSSYNLQGRLTDIPELANDIAENGLIVAVTVYKKKGEEKYTLIAGHRRIAAIDVAIADGRLNAEEFMIPMNVRSGMSDIERVLDLDASNSGIPLTALQRADVFKRAIAYGADEKMIAQKRGISETTVRNILLLATAGEPTKNLIRNGNIAATTVIGMLKAKEPSVVDAELTNALTEKKEAIRKEKPQLALADSIPVVFGGTNTEDNNDIPTLQDNTKIAGVSGMDVQLSDSSKPVKLTKKNLEKKEPKAETYTKEFILKLLADNDVTEDEAAYVILSQELK